LWQQGESDAKYLADANAYRTNMAALVALFRAEWPGCPWPIAKLNSDYIHTGNNIAKCTTTVQAAEAAFVSSDSEAVLVDLDSVVPNPVDHTP
jgi:Carbohydrate esterase, sialic acid-specific acetylesterase